MVFHGKSKFVKKFIEVPDFTKTPRSFGSGFRR